VVRQRLILRFGLIEQSRFVFFLIDSISQPGILEPESLPLADLLWFVKPNKRFKMRGELSTKHYPKNCDRQEPRLKLAAACSYQNRLC
jgi:hypothetical protein